jgi:hypothetical protein
VRSAAYTHNPLNQEGTAIGGSCLLVKIGNLAVFDQEPRRRRDEKALATAL